MSEIVNRELVVSELQLHEGGSAPGFHLAKLGDTLFASGLRRHSGLVDFQEIEISGSYFDGHNVEYLE